MAPHAAAPLAAAMPGASPPLGTVAQAHDAIAAWIHSIAPELPVYFDSAPADRAVIAVHLALTEMIPVRAPHGPRSRGPLKIELSYLLSVAGADSVKATQLTSDLLFDAMDGDRFINIRSCATIAQDSAARVASAGPGFAFTLVLQRAPVRANVAAPVSTLKVEAAPSRLLHGILRGPNQIPLPDAIIEVPSLNVYSRTDHKGRFNLGAISSGRAPLSVRITARGQQHELSAQIPPPHSPLLLDLNV